ncbi:MAG: protein phosphatase CheZ [Burkholderiales bacterium]
MGATRVDDTDLEALFDSLSDIRQQELRAEPMTSLATTTPAPAVVVPSVEMTQTLLTVSLAQVVTSPDDMFERIGHLTRALHDALRAVGSDNVLDRAAREFPDARDRLTYIAKLTEQAAERALGAVEIGQARQNELHLNATTMGARWDKFFAGEVDLIAFKSLVGDTRLFVQQAESTASATNAQLTEIMMAQDFQDLTGQVIQKLTRVVNDLEQQLLQFLIDAMPDGKRSVFAGDELEGPIVDGSARKDVVANQAQVDDLLESMGF